jgi:hypothetical protein
MGFKQACHLACNWSCSSLYVDRLPKFNDKLSIHSIARLYVGLGVSFGKVAAELLDLHEIVKVNPDRSEGKDGWRRTWRDRFVVRYHRRSSDPDGKKRVVTGLVP